MAPRLFREIGDGLLVLGPEPGGNGLFDVVEGFLLVPSLGDAAGEGGYFGNDPAILGVVE